MFILKQNNKHEEVTKQGFSKYSEENSVLGEVIHSSGWGGGERLFEFHWEKEGWALIRGWALINFFSL